MIRYAFAFAAFASLICIAQNGLRAEEEKKPVATYTAKWADKTVTVTASGQNNSSGWKNELIPVEGKNEFRFNQKRPGGIALQVITPFSTSATAKAETAVEFVTVVDANGSHRVEVKAK